MNTGVNFNAGSYGQNPFESLKAYVDKLTLFTRGMVGAIRFGPANPTSTDIAAGKYAVWLNTTSSAIGIYANNAGTVSSIGGGGGSTITLTTTGTSGVATLVGTTLNIPNYTTTGGITSVTGTANQITASTTSGATTLSLPTNVTVNGLITVGSTSGIQFGNGGGSAGTTLGYLVPRSDGVWELGNGSATGFGRLMLGGSTASFPAIVTNGTGISVKTADSSAFTAVTAGSFVKNGGTSTQFLMADGSSLTGPLPVTNGGTGTATPGLVAGTNVSVTGTWPNQTVNAAATSLKLHASVQTGTTLTLDLTASHWVFSGTVATVWTLPAIAGNTDVTYFIKNRGSAIITLQRAGSDNLYTSASVTNLVINPGESYIVANDGSFWLVS